MSATWYYKIKLKGSPDFDKSILPSKKLGDLIEDLDDIFRLVTPIMENEDILELYLHSPEMWDRVIMIQRHYNSLVAFDSSPYD